MTEPGSQHSHGKAQVVIEPDPSKVWRKGNLFSPAGYVVVLILSVSAYGDPSTHLALWQAALGFLVGIAGMTFIGYGVCFRWKATVAQTRYELDDKELRAVRKGRVLKRIPRASIAYVEMWNSVTWFRLLTVSKPMWPRAVVTLRDEGRGERRELLPELMLWGTEAPEEAEATIRAALTGQPR